jgi:hypothetical protein
VGRPVPPPTPERQPADSGVAEPPAPSADGDPAAPAPAHEADLVTDVPAADLRGVGPRLRRTVERVEDLVGDLAGSSLARRLAPWVTGAAALLGGAAYGVLRRRRRRRQPAAPAAAAHDTDTWLPGPPGLPPTEQP